MIDSLVTGGGIGGSFWTTASWLVGLAALLSLDDTALAQTWLSQPLPAGILAGYVCGVPEYGLALGLPLQLATMGNLPVGQAFVCEPVSAVCAGVGALALATGGSVTGGAGVVKHWLLDGGGSSGGAGGALGWVLVGVALLSVGGHWVLRAERAAHFAWMLQGHRSLRDGEGARLERIQIRCLLATALRGAALTVVWLFLLRQVWVPIYPLLPSTVQSSLRWLPLLAAGLAVGAMLDRFGIKTGWPWSLAGAVTALVLTVFVL